MKILSWNVNGFRAIYKKGFKKSIQQEDPDIICLQETKVNKEDVPVAFLEDPYFKNYELFWYTGARKGYSGVSIFTKISPTRVISGLGEKRFDEEGRVLTLEYSDFYLISTYFPNSQEKLARLEYKLDFCSVFFDFIHTLREEKEVIICGDINIAHTKMDLKNPKSNQKSPGFSIEERKTLSHFLSQNYVDIFRTLYPDTIAYTWWSYRYQSREKNIGWRIDYFFCHQDFFPKIKKMKILKDLEGSDHCPIVLEI